MSSAGPEGSMFRQPQPQWAHSPLCLCPHNPQVTGPAKTTRASAKVRRLPRRDLVAETDLIVARFEVGPLSPAFAAHAA